MKTIIIPTNFSETAENAVNYGVELARITGAKIILLHAYHFPIYNGEYNFDINLENDFEKKNRQLLESNRNEIIRNNPGIDIEIYLKLGLAGDVITEAATEKSADLILIGISESGIFGETILGSNAVETIRNYIIPVLIIPHKAKFKKVNKILFATDYSELQSNQPFNALVDFASYFNAHVYVVNVMKENEKIMSKKIASILNVKKILKNLAHSFHYPINANTVNGINEFVNESGAEIVAIIPHKHNIFYRVFNLGTTKKMAFHSEVPMLALPENVANNEYVKQSEYAAINWDLQDVI